MIKIVSVEQIRAIEAAADTGGLTYTELMERAGRVVAFRALELLEHLPTGDKAVTILVGGGNNGGDGLVAGRIIAEQNAALVRFYLLARRADDDGVFRAVTDAGLSVAYAEDDQRQRVLINMIASANVVIDALFGIGVTLPLRDEAAKILRFAAQAVEGEADEPPLRDPASPTPPRRRPYVIALDCPSGLDCDTGAMDKNTLHADETITFIAAKPGLLTFPGATAVGDLRISSLGVPPTLPDLRGAKRFLADAAYVEPLLPARTPDTHKGTYGKALIVGGSTRYMGAPALAANGAYAVGAGLVSVATPAPVAFALAGGLLETTWLPLAHSDGDLNADAAALTLKEMSNYDALAVGCGMGTTDSTRTFLDTLLPHPPTLSLRLLLDADALNILSEMGEWWTRLPAETILTPHPGEMARLCRVSTADVNAQRWTLAAEKAAAWNAIIVLKGAHTVIASPSGEIAVMPFKTSALAKAGTGDTLAGMIVGLLAGGLKPFDAAVCGAYLHGAAGVRAGKTYGERGTLARDVANVARGLFQ
ncbi:MAG: NAD(P)H-hydrate dehydratase [Chloroflexota bacterium]|nr:NAD(P)H-hydrate dehydratase [Chloroflexota bacterium]